MPHCDLFLEIANSAVATEDYYLPICGGMGMTMDTANSTEAVEGDSHGGTNNNKVDSVLKNSPDGGDMIKESGGGDRKSLEQLLDKFDSWKQGNVLFPVALGWMKKAKKERFYSAVTTEKDGTKVSLDEQSRILVTSEKDHHKAARSIQAQWRRYCPQSAVSFYKASRAIQTKWRSYVNRVRYLALHQKLRECCSTIAIQSA
jgi:hypothetical protein